MAFSNDANWSGLFTVSIDGIDAGEFQEVKLPRANIEIIEYYTGNNKSPRKRPGPVTWQNIVLRRGFANNTILLEWWEQISLGKADKRSVTIQVRDEEGNITMAWNCFSCWPCAWDLADFRAGSTELAIEEIELATERIEVAA